MMKGANFDERDKATVGEGKVGAANHVFRIHQKWRDTADDADDADLRAVL